MISPYLPFPPSPPPSTGCLPLQRLDPPAVTSRRRLARRPRRRAQGAEPLGGDLPGEVPHLQDGAPLGLGSNLGLTRAVEPSSGSGGEVGEFGVQTELESACCCGIWLGGWVRELTGGESLVGIGCTIFCRIDSGIV